MHEFLLTFRLDQAQELNIKHGMNFDAVGSYARLAVNEVEERDTGDGDAHIDVFHRS